MTKEKKRQHLLYVLGTEGGGKTSLVAQLQYMSEGKLCATPQCHPPTAGQNIHHIKCNDESDIEIRELGGTMAAMWRPFIAAQLAREHNASPQVIVSHGLCFVVDALAPHQLGLASCFFRELTEGVCRNWPTLIVLQRCAGPHRLTRAEVLALFEVDEANYTETLGTRVTLVEADTWSGMGLGDVWDWVCTTAAAA